MVSPQPTDPHLRIAHSLLEEIAMRDFSKRQRSVLDLLLRLSWGCGKKAWMYDSYADFEAVGVYRNVVSEELQYLETNQVIKWFPEYRIVMFNKHFDDWTIARKKKASSEHMKRLVNSSLQNIEVINVLLSTLLQNIVPNNETLSPSIKNMTDDNEKYDGDNSSNPCGSKDEEGSKESLLNKSFKISSSTNEIHTGIGINDTVLEEELELNEIELAFKRVEEKMIAKTGRMYYLKGDEPKNIHTFLLSGGTMDMLISAIDEAFEQYQPRYPNDKITSVNYCLSFAWKKLERGRAIGNGKDAQPMPARIHPQPRKRRNNVVPISDKLPEGVQRQRELEEAGAFQTKGKSIAEDPELAKMLASLNGRKAAGK
ncbi:replication protein [Brevibacillus reuszeri]|uniref:replication protein n=1 Tax=Brevibacillus reuszeri TaxID=54915 RepID=UPI000CCC17F6|nr:replication protein [Brevibacillus reuszeri]